MVDERGTSCSQNHVDPVAMLTGRPVSGLRQVSVVDLSPGDALYLPPYYLHATMLSGLGARATGLTTSSLNIWFGVSAQQRMGAQLRAVRLPITAATTVRGVLRVIAAFLAVWESGSHATGGACYNDQTPHGMCESVSHESELRHEPASDSTVSDSTVLAEMLRRCTAIEVPNRNGLNFHLFSRRDSNHSGKSRTLPLSSVAPIAHTFREILQGEKNSARRTLLITDFLEELVDVAAKSRMNTVDSPLHLEEMEPWTRHCLLVEEVRDLLFQQ